MTLLLDTCAFIWLTQEPGKLSATAQSAINVPANNLAFSHASAWEMHLKHHAGKLILPDPPGQWIPQQIAAWKISELAIQLSGLRTCPMSIAIPLTGCLWRRHWRKASPSFRPITFSPATVCRWFGEPHPPATRMTAPPADHLSRPTGGVASGTRRLARAWHRLAVPRQAPTPP